MQIAGKRKPTDCVGGLQEKLVYWSRGDGALGVQVAVARSKTEVPVNEVRPQPLESFMRKRARVTVNEVRELAGDLDQVIAVADEPGELAAVPRGRRKDASLKVPHPLWFEVRVGSGEEVELADGRASESPGSRTLQRDGLGQVIRKAGLGDRNRPEERVVLDPKSAVEDHAVGKELLDEGVSTNLVDPVLAEIEVVDVIARLAAVPFVVEPDGYHV